MTVTLDEKSGTIASLRKAGSDREWVKGQVNSYVYLPGSEVSGALGSGHGKLTVRESGPLVASLLVESDAPGCNRLVREVRLVDGLDRIDILNVVDKKPVRTVEGVHFGFAFNVPTPQVRINSPGGSRPARERPDSGRMQELVFRRALGGHLQRQLRCDLGHGGCAVG